MLYKARAYPSVISPLSCPPEEFFKEWRLCWKDSDRDTTKLYNMAFPTVLHWMSMLEDPDYDKDLSYQTLYARLESRGGNPSEQIDRWIDYAKQTTTLIEELEMILLRALRAPKNLAKNTDPRKVQYMLLTYFKGILKDEIEKVRDVLLDAEKPATSFTVAIDDDHADYLLIENVSLSHWEHYVFGLMCQGWPNYKIADHIGLHHQETANQRKHIVCQLSKIFFGTEALAISKRS